MSYTHTLSIQGVQAILQMNVEYSVVKYTLTLRADSGEEVVTNGHLPNDAIDQFIVINQHFTNPTSIVSSSVLPEPSKGLGDSLPTEIKEKLEKSVQTTLEQSVKDHIMADIFDFINQGQQQNQLHQSHVDIAVPNQSLESESFSPILSSSPRHAESFEQDLSNNKVVEESVSQTPFNEAAMMEQLQNLRTYSNPDSKHGIVEAVQNYLSENNINLLDHPVLCEFMKKLFYEMIVLHVNDDVLVGKFVKMLYLTGEQSDVIPKFLSKVWSQYALFCKAAAYYKITLNPTSFADYWKWNTTCDGPVVTRSWHQMKTFLLQ